MDLKTIHGDIIYSGDADTLRELVTIAARGDANLSGAYLRGVILERDAAAVGDRPLLSVGPIGSRGDYAYAWLTNKGVMIRAGCFSGWRDEFADAVEKIHGATIHGDEYRAALALIDKHAELWTPRGEKGE